MNIIQPQLGILSGPYSLHGFSLLASLDIFKNWISLISVRSAKNLPWPSAQGFHSHFKPFFAYLTISKGKWPQSSSRTGRDQRSQTALQNSSHGFLLTVPRYPGRECHDRSSHLWFSFFLVDCTSLSMTPGMEKPPLMEFANGLSSEIHTSTGLPQHCCQK